MIDDLKPSASPAASEGRGRAILIASAVFGFAYLLDGLGSGLGLELGAPYPFDVVIKAAGIVLLAVFALDRRRWLLAAGLGLGALGDVFLALKPADMPAHLPLGIAAFGLGHVIYVVLFAGILKREGKASPAALISAGVLAVFGVAMLIFLQPHFGELRVAASLYNGVIIAMACLALVGQAPLWAWLGALSFVVSDSLLALRMFAGMIAWAGPVVWATYYLGQLGLAWGLAAGPGSGSTSGGDEDGPEA